MTMKIITNRLQYIAGSLFLCSGLHNMHSWWGIVDILVAIGWFILSIVEDIEIKTPH